MQWTVSLCRPNDDTADTGTTVLAVEAQHGTFHTDTSLITFDKKNNGKQRKILCTNPGYTHLPAVSILVSSYIFFLLKLKNNSLGEAISLSTAQFPGAAPMFTDIFTLIESNRTDGDEIEYGYPITCGDSRAVLLFKKFVCPGINVRCVKVSFLLLLIIFLCQGVFSHHLFDHKTVAVHRLYLLHNINSLTTSSSVRSSLYTWPAKRHWRTGKGPSDWEGWCSGMIVLNSIWVHFRVYFFESHC